MEDDYAPAPCTRQECKWTNDEYRKLLDLCANLENAWQNADDDELAYATEELGEYTRTHHHAWQG